MVDSDGFESGKYLIRRKYFVPDGEIRRDYRDGHEKYVSNFLFDCDWEVDDVEDSFDA